MNQTPTPGQALNLNGPWAVEYSTDYLIDPDEDELKGKQVYGIHDAKGATVLYTDSGYFKPNPAYVAAIAALPELVQALEQAKALLELQAPCTPKGSPMFNAEQGKVYLAIEQALAMARGQG